MVRLSDLIRKGKDSLDEEAKDKKPAEKPSQPAPPPLQTKAAPIKLSALTKSMPQETAAPPPPPVQREAPPTPRTAVPEPAPPAPPAPMPAVVDWYAVAETSLQALSTAIRNQQTVSIADLPDIARGFITSLEKDELLFIRAISPQESGPSQVANMVRTAIFSLKIGKGLGYLQEKLEQLVLAALLHDVGMFRLPEELLNKAGRWSPQQRTSLHRHPTLGAELLRSVATDFPWLPDIIAQEHERADGTGYPRGLQGQDIHELAQVIGIADVLDAMLRSRLSRQALLPHDAMRLLLAREKTAFPTKLIKSVLEQFSLFPVRTQVKLTSGEIGFVARANSRFPLRPVVTITVDQGGQQLREPRELDLSRNPLVHISEIVETMHA
ncbi:MAG: HD domain-containing protein [Nitrospirae bacterium]|nr:HD domain-containing protein [Nitrospirota bacterium]